MLGGRRHSHRQIPGRGSSSLISSESLPFTPPPAPRPAAPSPRPAHRGDLSLLRSPAEAEAGDLARPGSSGTSVEAGLTSDRLDPSLTPLFR